MSKSEIIMFTSWLMLDADIHKSHVDIDKSHVDIDKSYVNIDESHVKIIHIFIMSP